MGLGGLSFAVGKTERWEYYTQTRIHQMLPLKMLPAESVLESLPVKCDQGIQVQCPVRSALAVHRLHGSMSPGPGIIGNT